jgi:hypothetical protein
MEDRLERLEALLKKASRRASLFAFSWEAALLSYCDFSVEMSHALSKIGYLPC